MDKILNKIINMFKSKYCSRKDYWIFYGISILCILILVLLGYFLDYIYEHGIIMDRYFIFVGLGYTITNIIMQIKRLRDANISPYILILKLVLVAFNLLTFDTKGFYFVIEILFTTLLLLPSQRMPTTDIRKEK